jgi:SAM-dependent methyltransferase
MSDVKQSVQDQFGRVAENYRTSKDHASGEDLAAITRLAQATTAPRVLDAGCGAGHASVAVAPHSREVVALDLTPGMLAQVERLAAERGLTNIRTQQGDVEHLPFDAGAFDLVVSRYSAHHWPQPARAVSEILRVLKPGGRFILSDIVAPEAPALDTFLQAVELLRDRSHVRDHTIAQWQALLAGLGATSRVVLTWQLPLDFRAWVERMATPPENVAMLRHLLATAPADARTTFQIEPDRFSLPGALFEVSRG